MAGRDYQYIFGVRDFREMTQGAKPKPITPPQPGTRYEPTSLWPRGTPRQIACTSGSSGPRPTAERQAKAPEIVARIQRDFQACRLIEAPVTSCQLVDALLAQTEALRLQRDSQQQAAVRALTTLANPDSAEPAEETL